MPGPGRVRIPDLLLGIGLAVVVAACGATTASTAPVAEPETEPAVAAVPMCEDVYGADDALDGSVPDDHSPAARQEWVTDLHEWAQGEVPGSFAGTYDETVAFTDDVEALTDEVHERFGTHLEVVEVDHTLADLEQVRHEASQEMFEQSEQAGDGQVAGQLTDVTVLPKANRVRLTVADLDDERAEELSERYGATHVCILDEPVTGGGTDAPHEVR